jgi:hypothetical protein
MKSNGVIILSVLLLLCYACGNNPHIKNVERDTTINETTSFNNLFLDSNTLHQFFVTNPKYGKYEKQFDDFYRERNYEYAWFDSSGMGEQARGFINLLSSTMTTMQDSSLYNSRLMSLYSKFQDSTDKPHTADEVLNTELLLTGQFFHYAAKMYKGTDSNIVDLGWLYLEKKLILLRCLIL